MNLLVTIIKNIPAMVKAAKSGYIVVKNLINLGTALGETVRDVGRAAVDPEAETLHDRAKRVEKVVADSNLQVRRAKLRRELDAIENAWMNEGKANAKDE